ncbi:MAG: CD0519/CD1768 family membrane protein [Bacteroidota bacterium]
MNLIQQTKNTRFIRNRTYEAFIFLIIFGLFFGGLGYKMGITNMLNTLMNTAWDLLMNTVFFIMGITVLSGALGKLMIEFGVVRLLEFVLKPLMKPLYHLPGVASLAALMTFFSDNPAIISLSNDKNFARYFRNYELISLTNFGTAFGMGLIVITFMTGLGFFWPAIIGLAGAVVGSVVSTRLMQRMIKGKVPRRPDDDYQGDESQISFRSEGPVFERVLNAVLDGGKQGVQLGLAIIPGVLIISTIVMMVTFGPADASAGYAGLAYEGVPVLPKLAGYLSGVFSFLFGFESPELVAFPITSLGAVGAALSLVKAFLAEGIVGGNEIAVFTAMGMCWSGYLSTHTAMLDTLGYRRLTSKALLSHTIGGLVAGVFAHYLFVIVGLF